VTLQNDNLNNLSPAEVWRTLKDQLSLQ